MTAAFLQKLRERRQEEERKRWKAQQEAQRLADERKNQVEKLRTLRLHAQSWERANNLRAYIGAIRSALAAGSSEAPAAEASKWLSWAEAHADELDPIHSGRVWSLTKLEIDEVERPPEKPPYGLGYRY